MSNVFRSDKKSSGGANLQNKSVTATVAAQTVLPDSGYDGLSEVTVNPQDHTATHELVTTNHPANNPLDLGANHNVRYIPIQVGEGTFQETTLWENSSPTASFSGQAVTLSDDITNYDYVRIYWNNNTSSSENASIIVPTDIMAMSGAVAGSIQITLGSRTSVDNRVRIVRYSSDTDLIIGDNRSVGEAGGNNNGIIPIKITGLSPIVVSGTKTITENGTGIDVANYEYVDVNVPGGGSLEETLLWENSTPSSSYGENTITLSDSVQNYDYLRFEFTRGTTNPEIFSVIYTVDELDNTAQNANGEKLSSPTIYVSGTGNYTRILSKLSDTSILFSHCKKYGTGIDTVNSDTTLMPYKVFGLKL